MPSRGTPVSMTRAFSNQHSRDYTDSIHGEGLFKRELTVTAVCTVAIRRTSSCRIRTRDHPSKSKIRLRARSARADRNIHRKVIRASCGEEPHLIPACVDCHEPHKVRRVFYPAGMSDRDCQRCHGDSGMKVTAKAQGKPMLR